MEQLCLSPVSGLQKGCRGGWRVQRQIHGQPDGPARIVRRDAGGPQPPHVSQFLPPTAEVAVYGNKTCPLKDRPRHMNGKPAPELGQFASDVLEGLTSTPKHLSSKY